MKMQVFSVMAVTILLGLLSLQPVSAQAGPVAFSVGMSQSVCSSTNNQVAAFNFATYDYGGDFDTTTHKFTAPTTGIYVFSLSLTTCVGNYGHLNILKNGNYLTHVWADDEVGLHGKGCNTVVAKLQSGDVIKVAFKNAGDSAMGGTGNSAGNTQFTGFLLAAL